MKWNKFNLDNIPELNKQIIFINTYIKDKPYTINSGYFELTDEIRDNDNVSYLYKYDIIKKINNRYYGILLKNTSTDTCDSSYLDEIIDYWCYSDDIIPLELKVKQLLT